MSRIVFAWELGGSLGHIGNILPFARELKARGHEVSLILRELQNVATRLDQNLSVFQAPIFTSRPPTLPEPILNYSEMLLRNGYFNGDSLIGLVRAWRSLIELLECDLLVADHSPTALLAARSLGVAAVTLGSGFFVPPSVSPLPNFRPWMHPPLGRLQDSDEQLLLSMNTVLMSYDKPPLERVGDLFDISEKFFQTYSELDHYQQREKVKYWGRFTGISRGKDISWPEGDGKCVFVYMQSHMKPLEKVLEAISLLGLRAVVAVPGISEELKNKYASSKIFISVDPVKLSKQFLAQCDFAVGYGGHGMTIDMLKSGVPLLLFPDLIERTMVANNVEAMGAGICVLPNSPIDNYTSLMRTLVNFLGYRQRAEEFSKKYAGLDQEAQLQQIVLRMEEIASVGVS